MASAPWPIAVSTCGFIFWKSKSPWIMVRSQPSTFALAVTSFTHQAPMGVWLPEVKAMTLNAFVLPVAPLLLGVPSELLEQPARASAAAAVSTASTLMGERIFHSFEDVRRSRSCCWGRHGRGTVFSSGGALVRSYGRAMEPWCGGSLSGNPETAEVMSRAPPPPIRGDLAFSRSERGQQDGGDDDEPRQYLLDVGVDAEDVQAVGHDTDDHHADHRAHEVGRSRLGDGHS